MVSAIVVEGRQRLTLSDRLSRMNPERLSRDALRFKLEERGWAVEIAYSKPLRRYTLAIHEDSTIGNEETSTSLAI